MTNRVSYTHPSLSRRLSLKVSTGTVLSVSQVVLIGSLWFGLNGSCGAQDLARGKEINATCAGCHGDLGQGGKRGEYPRISGQRVGYLVAQLQAFRARTRMNLAMFPYTQERELSEQDIADVSAYLASVELPTEWPKFSPGDDALTRLAAVEKVMIIARAPGDVDNGGRIYREECALCHGEDGRGKRKFPRLVGQYSNYLLKQMEGYRKGERPHDEEGMTGALIPLKTTDLQDILAYLTTLQTGGKP